MLLDRLRVAMLEVDGDVMFEVDIEVMLATAAAESPQETHERVIADLIAQHNTKGWSKRAHETERTRRGGYSRRVSW